MMPGRWFILLFTVSLPGYTESVDSNVVNERFPNPPGELEEHWRVDCTEVSNVLQDLVAAGPGKDESTTVISSTLIDSVRKCAMIYNVPGTESADTCPNYRKALEAISSRTGSKLNSEAGATIQAAVTCPGN